jgi:hypothetical protein
VDVELRLSGRKWHIALRLVGPAVTIACWLALTDTANGLRYFGGVALGFIVDLALARFFGTSASFVWWLTVRLGLPGSRYGGPRRPRDGT